jgi:uncharacterized membrane protein
VCPEPEDPRRDREKPERPKRDRADKTSRTERDIERRRSRSRGLDRRAKREPGSQERRTIEYIVKPRQELVESPARDTRPTTAEVQQQSFEGIPLTRPEYFFAVSHFYRGEVDRANTWRFRIDSTTNWAVASAAAFSGFALSHPEVPHVVVLFGNLVVFALLWIETRRFRVFDVFRARVRNTEENFFAPILTRELHSPSTEWGENMADDLLHPEFRDSFWEVMGLRLRRNYMFLFTALLCCWLVKVFVMPPPQRLPAAAGELERVAVLGLPAWLVLVTLGLFYGLLVGLLLVTHKKRRYVTKDWGTGAVVKWYDV